VALRKLGKREVKKILDGKVEKGKPEEARKPVKVLKRERSKAERINEI
jgi:hypothetical protein